MGMFGNSSIGRKQPSVSSWDPSWRDRIAYGLSDAAGTLGAGRYAQQRVSDVARNVLDFIPGVGEAIGANDVMRDLKSRNFGGAALNGLALAAGVVPGLGDAASKSIRKARGAMTLDYFGSPVRILQNPTPMETKGFLNRAKYKAARRITDPKTGDVYIWDASDPALHQLVAERLGLKYSPEMGDMIGVD